MDMTPIFSMAWANGGLVIKPSPALDQYPSLMAGNILDYGDFRLPPTRMSGRWGLNDNLGCSWSRLKGTTWTAAYPRNEEQMYALCASLSHVVWKLTTLREPGPVVLPTSISYLRREKGCGVWVSYSEKATEVFRTWKAGDTNIALIAKAMKAAYRATRRLDDFQTVEGMTGAAMTATSYPLLDCLGASFGVPPEEIDGDKAQASCANCDHPRQLLVLLAGVAAMCDIVEVQAAALS